MLDITDRTVVITGGATGIGFGLAKALGARGANVVMGEPRQARLCLLYTSDAADE